MNGDQRSPEEISMDHFYQLVLMHQRSREAWQEEYPVSSPANEDHQERLALERKKLLDQKTEKKKSNE